MAFSEADLTPNPSMTYNERRLTVMIKKLIEGVERETISYKELEEARKLVFTVEHKKSDVIELPTKFNLYDQL
jgi:hypothetical protein